MTDGAQLATAIITDLVNNHPEYSKFHPNSPLATNTPISLLSGQKGLKTTMASLTEPSIFLHWDQLPASLTINNPFDFPEADPINPTYVIASTQKIPVDDKMANGLLIIVGSLDALYEVQLFRSVSEGYDFTYPIAKWAAKSPNHNLPSRPSGVETSDIEFYTMKDGDVITFLKDPSIKLRTKIISIYYRSYPSCEEFMSKTYQRRRYRPAGSQALVGLAPSPTELPALLVVCCLAPAYTTTNKLSDQLLRRYSAMNAEDLLPALTAQDFSMAIAALGWDPSMMAPAINAVLMYILAIDKNGKADNEVKTADLMTIADYAKKWHLDVFYTQLYEQMRMVYQNHQSRSILFGANAYPLMAKFIKTFGPRWTSETDKMDSEFKELSDKPYLNVMDKIPESRQVAAIPRIIYIGLQYYAANLQDPTEEANFRLYNIDGVKQHINPIEDVNVCDTVVRLLPRNKLVAVNSLVPHLAADDIINILATETEAFKIALYHLCLTTKTTGKWFTFEQNRIKMKESQKIQASMEAVILAEFERRIAALVAQGSAISDPAQFAAHQRKVEQYRVLCETERLAQISLDTKVVPASSPEFEGLRDEVLKKNKSWWDKVMGPLP
ncbi:hypothetical protein 1 [Beihai rhabdo-like virus 2]|uniref:Uncharacterized protein n=1 Tax=Beihai rhabdo-like virus 2 TaxID=1922652 RepID=A0A1L3KMW3_9MONO|nr:hypothetical protein 1 [Beihai rhabdo-like virus 2]APG78669.1 hypothetical protein 1 [Beihai rhabdo-like virus 2]